MSVISIRTILRLLLFIVCRKSHAIRSSHPALVIKFKKLYSTNSIAKVIQFNINSSFVFSCLHKLGRAKECYVEK